MTLKPIRGKLYHGAIRHEDGLDKPSPPRLRRYEETVGRQAAWVCFSHNWYQGETFP